MKNILKVICYAIFTVTCVAYLIALVAVYMPPSTFQHGIFFSLTFPILAASVLGCCVISIFFSRKISAAILVIFLLGFQQIRNVFAVNVPKAFTYQKPQGSIRIMTWNVHEMGDSYNTHLVDSNPRLQLLQLIQQYNPDVLCVQDLLEYHHPDLRSAVNDICAFGNFNDHYFPVDRFYNEGYGEINYGSAIFSKLPLENVCTAIMGSYNDVNEQLLHASINLNGKHIAISTLHLRSMSLKLSNKLIDHKLLSKVDTVTLTESSVAEKLLFFSRQHERQAKIVKKHVEQFQPTVICGDFNSVPSSYVYNKLKANYTDAFLGSGNGFGATYRGISPTLRIDYLLLHPSVKLIQSKVDYRFPNSSDHYPVIADIAWNK